MHLIRRYASRTFPGNMLVIVHFWLLHCWRANWYPWSTSTLSTNSKQRFDFLFWMEPPCKTQYTLKWVNNDIELVQDHEGCWFAWCLTCPSNPSSAKWEIKATLAPRETYFFQSVNTVWNTTPKPKAFQNYVKRKVMFLKWLLLKKSLKDWETYSVEGGSGDSGNMKEEAVGEVSPSSNHLPPYEIQGVWNTKCLATQAKSYYRRCTVAIFVLLLCHF